jgi:hypothetical protein
MTLVPPRRVVRRFAAAAPPPSVCWSGAGVARETLEVATTPRTKRWSTGRSPSKGGRSPNPGHAYLPAKVAAALLKSAFVVAFARFGGGYETGTSA